VTNPVARTNLAAPREASQDARALALRPESATPAQAALQFEALFVAELLKSAQRPAFGESLLSGGSAGATYRDMFADEVARRLAARGGFGLASAIAREVAPAPKETP
jgi:Rod binding domain-containing protein